MMCTKKNNNRRACCVLLWIVCHICFRVSDEGGKMQFSKVKSGAIGKADFKTQVLNDSQECYFRDEVMFLLL